MSRTEAKKAQELVRDSGGRVVGRTRLQKIGYILSASGLDDAFQFSYKHYGPFSEDLATATREAKLLGLMKETEQVAAWGGSYSIFQAQEPIPAEVQPARRNLANLAAQADSVELELAATALFLSKEGIEDPWEETERRKPEKADQGRLEAAKELYQQLRAIPVPVPLPNIQ
ncbi:MAG: hypothetical protein EOR00_12620 [Mesorhizobium sp.]|jgi:uncharacterized protein YwgA|uniref:hypothetical protein n=1 Tax=Mesorhizobium sp. TaxID=1871066 RepID=UPI000FE6FA89|nr:hypothetical protein [Mesorhizobium sp.]RWP18202.1 MAG: hypothetical protein EOR00_12620 [Mesorhizobium sp.]RWP38241.1 MAG: hypothetical protein EOR03_01810 [Mesorhizobium sp.]